MERGIPDLMSLQPLRGRRGHQPESLSPHFMLTASVGLRVTHSAQQRQTAEPQENASHLQHGWVANEGSLRKSCNPDDFLYVMAHIPAPAGTEAPEILASRMIHVAWNSALVFLRLRAAAEGAKCVVAPM